MVNYKLGKIYKIINDVSKKEYYGSTCRKLSKRMVDHRSCARNKKQSILYKYMDEIGFEHFNIILVENYPCKNRDELLEREAYWIKLKYPQLNDIIPLRTQEERDNYDKVRYEENETRRIMIQSSNCKIRIEKYMCKEIIKLSSLKLELDEAMRKQSKNYDLVYRIAMY